MCYLIFMAGKIRAGIYIDGANIFHGGLGAGWQIDFAKLLRFIQRKYDPVVLSYYNCIGFLQDPKGNRVKDEGGEYILNPGQVKFHHKLEGIGFRVVTKPLKYINGRADNAKNKMDGQLILSAYKESDSWDTLLLFSGDSDFEPLIDEVVAQKKAAAIFSFRKNMAFELKRKAVISPNVSFTKLDELRKILEKDT